MKSPTHALSLLSLFLPSMLLADWPQFHGPTLNNQSPEKVDRKWPKAGPREIWRQPFNTGFSSMTVSGGRAFTLERRAIDGVDREIIRALDADTGRELWVAPLDIARYTMGGNSGARNNRGGDGPRSTPSIDGDRVYAYSSRLKLFCFNAATGAELWMVDILKNHHGRNIMWESAASPVVEGDLVFVYGGGPGEALLAFDKISGQVVWKGQSDGMTHSTPTVQDLHGVRQVIFSTQRGLVSVLPEIGEVLWRQPFPHKASRAITPVVAGDLVYISQGYGIGAGTYRVHLDGAGWRVEEVWRTPNKQMNHWSTPVVYKGHVYGIFNHNKHAVAPLKCVNLLTGEDAWEQPGFGMGNLILADERLIVLTDYGELVLVKPTPSRYREVSRAKVLSGKCWSTPTLSNGRLFARSTTEGVCLDVSR